MDALHDVLEQCAPTVQTALMQSLIKRESAFQRFAIGMDSRQGWVVQPNSLEEAIQTVERLKEEKRSFSLGYAQIHISNVDALGLTIEQAFNPCVNIHASELILNKFYTASLDAGFTGYIALFTALRGYNSGSLYAEVSNDYAAEIIYTSRVSDYSLSGRGILSSADINSVRIHSKLEGEDEKKPDDFFNRATNGSNDFFSNNSNSYLDVFKQ